ncbi:MAG TPA: hypothetical protein VKB46_15705 [Pyrinomonadaceae bacterium]|nr:hypothetical protein [Pyrinomonadaceae bacterium]
MRYVVFTLTLLLLTVTSVAKAQRSVSELPSAHADALQQFLAKHQGLEFLPETAINKDVLREMRNAFGVRFKPYYRTGDFNHDGLPDFAMILGKEGGPTGDQGPGIAETHRYLYDVTIVIFNGAGKSYKPAFVKTTKAPLVCVLTTTSERRRRLSFGVFETDEGFIMTPAGKGYIIEQGAEPE